MLKFLHDQRGLRSLYLSKEYANEEEVRRNLDLKEKKKMLEQQDIEKRRQRSQEEMKILFEKGKF